MRYKTLFRLLIKFFGVFLICEAIRGIACQLFEWGVNRTLQHYQIEYSWYPVIDGVVGIAIGLYLFLGGKWIVDKAIPSNRPYCHECGYDLTGAVGNICNECGTPFRGEAAPTHG